VPGEAADDPARCPVGDSVRLAQVPTGEWELIRARWVQRLLDAIDAGLPTEPGARSADRSCPTIRSDHPPGRGAASGHVNARVLGGCRIRCVTGWQDRRVATRDSDRRADRRGAGVGVVLVVTGFVLSAVYAVVVNVGTSLIDPDRVRP
jgi:hypothetical protein